MILNNPVYYSTLKRTGKVPFWLNEKVELLELESKTLKPVSDTTIDLFPNQFVAYQSLKNKTACLLEAPTSFGKSVLAIALHQSSGGRTLIAVHSLTLAKQFSEEFKKFIGVTPTFYCNGKHDLTGDVVITTHTTLRQKYSDFINFTTLIIDEADVCFSNKSLVAINNIATLRKYAFTGTTKTDYDEHNTEIGSVLGVFWGAHITAQSDKENPLKSIYYKEHTKQYTHKINNKTLAVLPKDWQLFREHLDNDIGRKQSQMSYLLENTNGKEPTLILLDRVADTTAWYKSLLARDKIVYIQHGEMKKKDREDQLAQFHKTGGYLVGQTATLDRGYSNTALVKAFIFFPINAKGRGENRLRQIIGRLMRHFTDKEAYLYLWRDSSLKYQWRYTKATLEKHFPNIPIYAK